MNLQDTLTGLGKKIRTLRKAKRLTQEQLAFSMGREASYMSNIERGKANVTVKTLHLIAEELQVEVKELFD